jgi:hypothetical protein
MKIAKIIVFPLILFIFIAFTYSCSQEMEAHFSGKEKLDDYSMMTEIAGEAPATPPPGTTEPTPKDPRLTKRKIIKSAEVTLTVNDFFETFKSVEKIIEKEGGFIADSSSYKSETGSISGNIIIRIPPDRFEQIIDQLKELGDVEYQRISGEDITREYYDLENRLKSKEAMEKRLLELLATRTNNVSDLLEVEKELGRVREEIESMKGSLRYYDNMVGLSTITLELSEPEPITPVAKNIFKPIKEALRKSLEILSESLAVLIVFVMAIIPWLILGFVIFLIVRAIVRKRKKEKEKAKTKKK